MNFTSRFANPLNFQKLADKLLPWIMAGAAVAFAIGLGLALVESPRE